MKLVVIKENKEFRKKGYNMKVTDTHYYFWGGICSNWYTSEFTLWGITFNCSEQAFMYAKAIKFDDAEIATQILHEYEPSRQKKLGRLIKNYDDAIWNEVRYDIMVEILRAKFSNPQKSLITKELLATGDRIIVEASPYDKIWGVGLSEEDIRILDERNWKGYNLLGKALMQVRSELQEQ